MGEAYISPRALYATHGCPRRLRTRRGDLYRTRPTGRRSGSGLGPLGPVSRRGQVREPTEKDGESGIAPVTSPEVDIEDEAEFCGMATEATLSPAALLNDCRPIGVGDVIEGIIGAVVELELPLVGPAGWASDEVSAAGIGVR